MLFFRQLIFLAATLVFGVVLQTSTVLATDKEAEIKRIEASLKKYGIAPTREGLEKSLRVFDPAMANEEKIHELIAKLSSDNYQERIAATKALANTNPASIAIVKSAVETNDLEVRLRLQQVLRLFEVGSHLLPLRAVLKYIEKKEVVGLTPEIWIALKTIGPDAQLLLQFRKSIIASSQKSDSEFLQQKIADSANPFRSIALEAAAKVFNVEIASQLSSLATADDDDSIRLIASRELAKQLDRRCLSVLIELLSSEEMKIRIGAAKVLQSVTGEKISFYGGANLETRNKSIGIWKQWFAKNGETVTLLELKPNSRIYVNQIVVTDYTKKIVTVRDIEGKVLRTIKGLKGPYGISGTADGHVIVAEYTGKQIIEYDENDKEVWKYTVAGMPISVQRLENGNTLIAISDSKKVIEIDPEKKVVWEFSSTGRVQFATRTDSDTTLLSLYTDNKVVEVDSGGDIIMEFGVKQPQGLFRLENGNTLVCSYSGTVSEFDSSGEVVWSADGLKQPLRAQKMADGNIIIMAQGKLRIVDESGTTVREISTGITSGTMQYY